MVASTANRVGRSRVPVGALVAQPGLTDRRNWRIEKDCAYIRALTGRQVSC